MTNNIHRNVNGLARRRGKVAIGASAMCAIAMVGPAMGQAESRAVFIVNNTSAEISAITIDETDMPSLVGNFASDASPQALALSPNGRYLAVGHGTQNDFSEALLIYEVNSDASLTEVFSGTVPDSPLDMTWINNQVIAITDTNIGPPNWTRTYAWDGAAQTFMEIDSIDTGSFNVFVTYLDEAGVLYTQSSLGTNMIEWASVAPDGTMSPTGSLATGDTFALEMAATNDESYLYAAAGISNDGDKISGFAIGAGGDLTPLDGSPFVSPGNSPADLAVSSDDALLFVGHGSDATVRSFFINKDGSLTATGNSFDVGLQGTIGDVAILDDLLLVTDDSTAFDGISGLFVFQIKSDGSFTQIGDAFQETGGRPQMMAVWSPAACPADLVGDDATVGVADLLDLLANWGTDGAGADLAAPTGVVDVADLLELLDQWGPCP